MPSPPLDCLTKTLNATTGPIRHTVIWLHGLGADGHDFVDILPLITPDDRAVRYILPHAPMQPITINNYQLTRAWFDIYDLGRMTQEDELGIRRTQLQLNALIQQQIDAGIPATRIVLAGFSQGGAMALFCGLRFPHRLAGILGLSTFLPLQEQLQHEYHAAQSNTPILMMHGETDPLIPIHFAQSCYHTMRAVHTPIEWKTYPMSHEICMPQLQQIKDWLTTTLA